MKPLLLLALLLGAAGCATTATEGGGTNLLLIGQDADPGTVPRTTSAFQRMLNAVADGMIAQGFDVFDEAALQAAGSRGAGRLSDAAIVDLARASRTPLDVAAIYAFHYRMQDLGHTRRVHTRVAGRLIDVRSGRWLGSFEVEPARAWNVAPGCSRDCVMAELGEHARTLGADVAAVLGERLHGTTAGAGESARPGRNATGDFTIQLDGFSPAEVFEVEDGLTRLDGYRTHRVVYSSATRTEYFYRSGLDTRRLNHGLQGLLDDLMHRAVVRFSGSTFEVEKSTRRPRPPLENDYEW